MNNPRKPWFVVAFTLTLAAALLPGCPLIAGLDGDYGLRPTSGDGGQSGVRIDGAVPECATTRCGSVCTDLTSDPTHCGTCGKVCSVGATCQASHCSTDVRQLAAGGDFACALRWDGNVWCWGQGIYGQLGGPIGGLKDVCSTKPTCAFAPRLLANLTDVTAISIAGQSACAIKSDRSVWCWGKNDAGQLGRAGDPNCATAPAMVACNPIPTKVPDVEGIVSLGHTENTFFAVNTTGAVQAWGANGYGLLGDGAALASATAIRASAQPVPSLGAGVKKVTESLGRHVCALKMDGSVFCWGQSVRGSLGHPSAEDLAFPATGTDRAFFRSTPTLVAGLNGDDIAASYDLTYVHSATVWKAFGNNAYAGLGNGTISDALEHVAPVAVMTVPTPIRTLSAGFATACAIDDAGKPWCWGRNLWAAMGDGTFGPAPAGGQACEGDGSPPCRPDARSPRELTSVVEIAVGTLFAVARKQDGSIWAWGANPDGRLGHAPGTPGDETNCNIMTKVEHCGPRPTQVRGFP
jgi:alpha-tubulin suppressor-like RCC1 family protein